MAGVRKSTAVWGACDGSLLLLRMRSKPWTRWRLLLCLLGTSIRRMWPGRSIAMLTGAVASAGGAMRSGRGLGHVGIARSHYSKSRVGRRLGRRPERSRFMVNGGRVLGLGMGSGTKHGAMEVAATSVAQHD
jgi:hypothetical protein